MENGNRIERSGIDLEPGPQRARDYWGKSSWYAENEYDESDESDEKQKIGVDVAAETKQNRWTEMNVICTVTDVKICHYWVKVNVPFKNWSVCWQVSKTNKWEQKNSQYVIIDLLEVWACNCITWV